MARMTDRMIECLERGRSQRCRGSLKWFSLIRLLHHHLMMATRLNSCKQPQCEQNLANRQHNVSEVVVSLFSVHVDSPATVLEFIHGLAMHFSDRATLRTGSAASRHSKLLWGDGSA